MERLSRFLAQLKEKKIDTRRDKIHEYASKKLGQTWVYTDDDNDVFDWVYTDVYNSFN